MYYAVERGFFKQAGLDVNLQAFSGGGAIAAALAGGALDVACANVGVLSNAHSRGIPISVIAPGGGYSSDSPTTVLAIAKNSPIASAKDLNGKTVALSTLRDLQQASVMKWVDGNGGDSSTLKFVEMSVPEMEPAIQAGRVQAATLLEPSLSKERDQIKVLADCYDSIAKQFFITLHAGSNDWLGKNPETARKFAAALRQAADWAAKNRAAAGEIFARVSKIPPATIAQMARTAWYPTLDPKLIQPVIDATAHYKFLASDFSAQEFFWRNLRT
jgi:NitT/TauT family transport system substrate-binding protein